MIKQSETETNLVSPSSPPSPSPSSFSSSSSYTSAYEALNSSEEERVLSPTYPWDYQDSLSLSSPENLETCQIR